MLAEKNILKRDDRPTSKTAAVFPGISLPSLKYEEPFGTYMFIQIYMYGSDLLHCSKAPVQINTVFYLPCYNSAVVLFPVPAATPNPDEEAPVGPGMYVDELEKEPSGWITQNTSNFDSTGLSFPPSVEQVMLKAKVPLLHPEECQHRW